ncbi:hypothetical protein [uncultured Selenomonas sp.]|uniref:hypothetical protein n=1 Tax=uncultured Selenomonas sp. TaxID=159275 RepID=UPI0028EC2A0C|nr:hypothetical protein [uncultured Selenomonas sp.]
MKNYIVSLSEEDLLEVCTLISGKVFRKLFQKHSRAFTNMKPGFRAAKLSDEDAVLLAVNNSEKTFIAEEINQRIEKALGEVTECSNKQVAAGKNADDSLVEALAQSVFHNHITLYRKLSRHNIEHIPEITERVASIRAMKQEARTPKVEVQHSKASWEALYSKIEALETQLAEAVQRETDQIREREQCIHQLTVDRDTLQREYNALMEDHNDLREQIDSLKKQLSKYKQREAYDDRSATIGEERNFAHRSLCEVFFHSDSGKIRLARLADLSQNDLLEVFHQDRSQPRRFNNRDWIYHNNGPDTEGAVGLWDWSAEENRNTPENDYIHSAYYAAESPIEIINISDCESASELIDNLKEGIHCNPTSGRVMFSGTKRNGECFGILCKRKQLTISGSAVTLNESVYHLPQYNFGKHEIISLPNQRSYFRHIYAGLPSDVIQTRDMMEIVQSVILRALSWQSLKERGVTKADWQRGKEFLGHLQSFSLTEDIAKTCCISLEEAENLRKQFLAHAEAYISGASIEDELLCSLLHANDDIMARCMEIASSEWKQKHAQAVRAAEEKIAQKEAERNCIQQECEKLSTQKAVLCADIRRQEQFAAEVEQAVAEKIRDAQNQMSKFIASISVVSSLLPQPTSSATNESAVFVSGRKTDEAPQMNQSWEEVCDTLGFELKEAGVAPEYTRSLAAYLYAAYLEHIPLLLTGPNADSIADTVSASLFGRTCGKLECTGSFDANTVSSCLQSEDSVIKIVNPFSHEWISRIPEILTAKEAYFISVHPFPEMLQFEPHGLFQFMIPLFTEFFVEANPGEHLVGGTMADKFEVLQVKTQRKFHSADFTRLHTPLLLKNKFQTLLSYMETILDGVSDDNIVLFALLPYACATGQKNVLGEILSDENGLHLSKNLKEQLEYMFGM